MTETQKPCWYFLCETSGLPTVLPLDRLRQLAQGRGNPPKDYPDVAFLCPHCTRIEIHSLDPDSPYYRQSDRVVESSQSADVISLVWFESCTAGCTFLLPVIAVSNSPTTAEAMRKDWSYLCCPNGHPIRFPQE
jgi:hypothetical protein